MTRYLTTHEPLCQKLKGLKRLELSSPSDMVAIAGRPVDRRGAPFLVAELYFEDRPTFEEAMTSSEGTAVLADLDEFAAEQVSMYLAEVDRDHSVIQH